VGGRDKPGHDERVVRLQCPPIALARRTAHIAGIRKFTPVFDGLCRFPPRTIETMPGRRALSREVLRGMAEQFVGKISEFQDGDRRIIFVGDNEIGVFRHEGQFFAYSNFCLHQGGPACEGLTIAKVEERIMPDKTSRGMYFSDTEMHFVCPWHGYEYDMKTGECVSDRKLKLRKYKVVEKEDGVYVVA
jgi:nitrite reductase/ring-hydroxylating ferredoxin subunit